MDEMDAEDLKNLEALSELDFLISMMRTCRDCIKALPDDFISGDNNFIERLKEYLLPDTEDSKRILKQKLKTMMKRKMRQTRIH